MSYSSSISYGRYACGYDPASAASRSLDDGFNYFLGQLTFNLQSLGMCRSSVGVSLLQSGQYFVRAPRQRLFLISIRGSCLGQLLKSTA